MYIYVYITVKTEWLLVYPLWVTSVALIIIIIIIPAPRYIYIYIDLSYANKYNKAIIVPLLLHTVYKVNVFNYYSHN